MTSFIENQEWRYATKKFDSSKKVSDENIEILNNAVQLSTSSYGLQLYKVFIVNNSEIRAQLKPASWGQQQITDASHLFVFAGYTKVSDEDIDHHINNIEHTRDLPSDALTGYGTFMKTQIGGKSKSEIEQWTAKQTYLALGNLLNAAAELKIDVCPMEGFDAKQYSQILGLEQLGLEVALVAPVGYRATEDDTQHQKKVRKSIDELFITIN